MDYTKLSDKHLKLIIENLKNEFESEGVDYEDDSEAFASESLNIVDSTLKYFGFTPHDEVDYSFFIALCRLNENSEGPIKRPKLETYQITHIEEMVEYKTYEYSTNMNSYLPLNKDLVYSLGNNDLYLYYDGTIIRTDVDETEHREDYIDKITKLKRFN
jgi:hypothetical protein